MEKVSPVVSKQYVICIDIKSTFCNQDAHPQIVATHCRMSASRECLLLRLSIPLSNVLGSGYVVKHPERKALRAEPLPTVDAGLNVFRHIMRIVPVLYDFLRNTRSQVRSDNIRRCRAVQLMQREVSDKGGSQTIVLLESQRV